VVNLDQERLDGLIRTAVASARYQGVVEAIFPLTFAEVTVRLGAEPKPSFKDLFYRSMEPPSKKDSTKRYECVEVIWPFANVPANEAGRRCAVQNEQDWWDSWKDAVQNAVLARKTGFVTLKDRMDVAMGVAVPEPGKDWVASKSFCVYRVFIGALVYQFVLHSILQLNSCLRLPGGPLCNQSVDCHY
jgi:hypothetical protein